MTVFSRNERLRSPLAHAGTSICREEGIRWPLGAGIERGRGSSSSTQLRNRS